MCSSVTGKTIKACWHFDWTGGLSNILIRINWIIHCDSICKLILISTKVFTIAKYLLSSLGNKFQPVGCSQNVYDNNVIFVANDWSIKSHWLRWFLPTIQNLHSEICTPLHRIPPPMWKRRWSIEFFLALTTQGGSEPHYSGSWAFCTSQATEIWKIDFSDHLVPSLVICFVRS